MTRQVACSWSSGIALPWQPGFILSGAVPSWTMAAPAGEAAARATTATASAARVRRRRSIGSLNTTIRPELRASAATERGLPRPVDQEGLHPAPQILGAPEPPGGLGGHGVGGVDPALQVGPQDVLRRRVGARGPRGEPFGQLPGLRGQLVVGSDEVDDVPALERGSVVEPAGHDELPGPAG